MATPTLDEPISPAEPVEHAEDLKQGTENPQGNTEDTANPDKIDPIDPHADRPTALTIAATEPKALQPRERAVLIMQQFQIDEEAFFAENGERLQEITALPPSHALKALDKLCNESLGKQLTKYVQTTLLPQVPEGHPDFSLEKVGTIDFRIFTGIKPQSAEYTTWYKIISAMSDLKNRLIGTYVAEDKGSAPMHEVSKLEYLYFGKIASSVNALYLAWHNNCGKIMSAADRQKHGFRNEIATVGIDGSGQHVEKPWNIAFPREIDAVVQAYEELAGTLNGVALTAAGVGLLSEEDGELFATKANYYRAVAKAYSTSKYKDFLAADTLLPGQNLGRTDISIHIHTIEYGYGEDPTQRTPEASIRYPDADEQKVNEMALRTRTDMLRELGKFLSEGTYTPETNRTRDMVGVTTYLATHFLNSGFGLDFVAAGQLLPNEEICRLNGGVSVTINGATMAERMEEYHDGMDAVFGKEKSAKLMPRAKVDLAKMYGKNIASHEFGHPIANTQGALDRLNKTRLNTTIEEWKATVGGMVLGEWRTLHNPDAATKLTMDDLRESVIAHIAGASRYAMKRGASHAIPYFRKSIMLMKAAEETGIVYKTEDGWDIDTSDKKITAFYQLLETQYLKVIEIYDHGTPEDLRAHLAKELVPCRFSEYVVDKIDATYPNRTKGAQTLTELCNV